jgi:hypothetical protein
MLALIATAIFLLWHRTVISVIGGTLLHVLPPRGIA